MTTHTLSMPDAAVCEKATEPKAEKKAEKARGGVPASMGGTIWFIGWLFTIGYAELVWWKALLGLIVWPYFLGTAVR